MNSRNVRSPKSSRRTASSPYLTSLHNRTTSSQYRPKPNSGHRPKNVRYDKHDNGGIPPRQGTWSAPTYSSVHSEIREYYQRREQMQKEIQRSLLKTKLDRLSAYKDQLSKEIDDLERSCGDVGIHAKKRPSNKAPPAASKGKLKQFRVLGGCPGNLAYKIHRKPDKEGKIRSFSIEVDVRGFMAENVEILTEDQEMVVKASKMNGMKKDLKVVAPSIKDMEKAYIHPPRFGVLVIDF